MANSIPDIYINGSDWVDVYSTTGIAVGTPLLIQNKSSNALLIYIFLQQNLLALQMVSLLVFSIVFP